ncbi:hypothetical protein AMELA_G00098000 [Ameiurus melas]|uniref:Uncharacterized protein n=1 Tax=Ameiurus melas TaxID=219545 RepID=A0A7J6ASU4_AMEME|nr:hypothetical protein AMELA_G00098000 [Ameiurus melas]
MRGRSKRCGWLHVSRSHVTSQVLAFTVGSCSMWYGRAAWKGHGEPGAYPTEHRAKGGSFRAQGASPSQGTITPQHGENTQTLHTHGPGGTWNYVQLLHLCLHARLCT